MRVGAATLSFLKQHGDDEAALMLKAGSIILRQAHKSGLTPGFFFIKGKLRLVPVPKAIPMVLKQRWDKEREALRKQL
jgi:hypothetical protein